ncbi:MAG: hypothetical protein JWM34_5104 [Ilumatobacteraceae bacterium]|nr:hypothetical protein [Ilumatobacteraceae bacterium]
MRRVWMIRAGDEAQAIDSMRAAGQIGVRYETIGDARLWTPAEIDEATSAAGRGSGRALLRANVLSFANHVRLGDLVVSPNPRRHEIWLGVVAGEYQYAEEPAVEGYQHTHQVEWKGWLDRDAVWIRDQLKTLDRPLVMYELPAREWWWHQVDTRELGYQPRPVRAETAKAARAPRSSSPAAPRGPRAPRPSTSTRKPPIVMVRCAGTCGFQWAPSSLVNGLCADCRADL